MTTERPQAVAILTSNYWPEPTGTGRVIAEFAEYLASSGVPVTVVTSMPFYPAWSIWAGYRGKLWLREAHRGVRISRCWHFVRPDPSSATRILQDLTLSLFALPSTVRAFAAARAVFVVSPALVLATVGMAAAWLLRKRRTLIVHDVMPDTAIELGMLRSPAARAAGRLMARLIYRLADEIHTVGPGMVTRIASQASKAATIRAVPNTVDPRELKPVPPDRNEFARQHFSAESFDVLHFGNMGRKQDLDIILRAASRLRNDPVVRFHVVGDGAARPAFLEKRAAAGLDNVTHRPLQPRWMLPHMLSAADAVLVSQASGVVNTVVPSKLSTALGAGAMVIVSAEADSEAARMVRDADVGLVVPAGDDAALVEAIDALRAGRVDSARLRRSAREHAVRVFGREAVYGPIARDLGGRPRESWRSTTARGGATLGGAGAEAGTAAGPFQLEPQEVEYRLREARRRGRPRYPWPHVPVNDWRDGLERIGEATARVLADDAGVRLSATGGAEEAGLAVAAFTSGLGPLLGYWAEQGRLGADASLAVLLAAHLDHGRRRADRAAVELNRALNVLAGASVTATVIKGAHTGTEYFPEPGARPVADIDLVVDDEAVERALAALDEAGYRSNPVDRRARPLRVEWLPPGEAGVVRSLLLSHADSRLSIDLHSTLDRTFFGLRTVRFDRERPGRSVDFGRAGARALAQPLLTAYLAAHAGHELHTLPLLRLVELVFVLRRDVVRKTLDWAELVELIEGLEASRFVYPALRLADELAPGAVPASTLDRLRESAPPRLRRAVDAMSPWSAQRLEGVSLADRFMWAEGPREHALRAVDAILPEWVYGDWRRLAGIQRDRIHQLLEGRVSLRSSRGSRGSRSRDE